MKLILSVLCIILFGVATTMAQMPIEGPWNGEIKIAGQVLPVVFHVTCAGDDYVVTLDSPLQGAKDIPATIKLSDDGTVDIEISIIGAKYSGKHTDGCISGIFSQSGLSLPLVLKPGEYEMPRPQTPRGPFPYETQDVTFVNPTDSAVLAGTLTLPLNYYFPMTKNVPVVVMVSGSGQQNRDEEILRHRPFAVLAHHFALNGIASLRYDDRGFAQSTGDVADATTATFAADACAAIDFVRTHVDKAGKIGVLGHSEGGTVAYMLGASGDADFIVSLCGPAVSGAEVLKAQNRALLAQAYPPGIVDEYVQALGIVLDYLKLNPAAKAYDGLDSKIAHLENLPADLRQNLHQVVQTNTPWLSYFIAYDPADAIADIACPVMAVYGLLDMQVDAQVNSEAMRDVMPDNPASVVVEYPGLNHLLQHATTGMPTEYGLIDETISDEVITDIIAWIIKVSKKPK